MFDKNDKDGRLSFLTESANNYLRKLSKLNEHGIFLCILIPTDWTSKITPHDIMIAEEYGISIIGLDSFKDRWGVTLLKEEDYIYLFQCHQNPLSVSKKPPYSPSGYSLDSMLSICLLIPD